MTRTTEHLFVRDHVDPVREAERIREDAIAAAEAEFKREYTRFAGEMNRKIDAAWNAYLAVLYASKRAA
jgi:hypothetical protein